MGRPPASEAKLSREVVVDAAIDLIERDGLAAFSMRSLARDLGVRPNAVYWHVADREALLGEVAEAVLAGVRLPDERLPWEVWFCEYARSYRRTLHAHPRLVPLINSTLASNTVSGLRIVEAFLAKLEEEGFEGSRLVDAFTVALGALVGFVGLELAPPPETDDSWSLPLRAELDHVDADRLPTVARHRDLLVNRAFVTRWVSGDAAPLDSGFEALLRVLLAGLDDLRR